MRQRYRRRRLVLQSEIVWPRNAIDRVYLQRSFGPFGAHFPLGIDTQNLAGLTAHGFRYEDLPPYAVGFNATGHVDTAADHRIFASLPAGPVADSGC